MKFPGTQTSFWESLLTFWDALIDPGPPHPVDIEATDKQEVGFTLTEAFQRHNQYQIHRGIRLMLVCVVVLYPAFFFVDSVCIIDSEKRDIITWIRWVVSGLLALIFFVSRHAIFRQYAISLGISVMYVVGLSIIAMTVILEGPIAPYYAGINLCILAATVIPWGHRPMMILGMMLWITYIFAQIQFGQWSADMNSALRIFFGNVSFMITTVILTSAFTWLSHQLRFEAFSHRHHQKKALEELNLAHTELNQQYAAVHTKTEQLADANATLDEQGKKLASANQRLTEQNHSIQAKTEELAALNQELAAQYNNVRAKTDELAELNKSLESHQKVLETTQEALKNQLEVKTRFLDIISHELRTPLTNLLTPLSMLRARPHSESAARLLKTMEINGEHLLELIDDILDFSRFANQERKFRREPHDLSSLIHEVSQSFEWTCQQRGLSLQLHIPSAVPTVWIDRKALVRVIRNLVSNSAKFTPPGGLVTIDLITSDRSIELSVTDTGIGIPSNDLRRIGTPFFQADTSHTRAFEGMGIGLALVRTIVDRHHGHFEIQSTPGQGTRVAITFTLDVPAEEENGLLLQANIPDSLRPGVTMQSESPITMRDEEDSGIGNDCGQSDSQVQESSGYLGRRPKVLIVEDHPDLREILSEVLQDEYDVITATDGEDGYERIMETRPDVVLSDIMMPRLSGLDLLHKIRSRPAFQRLPFLFLSARVDGADRVHGLKLGANDYVTKPFLPEELRARVLNLVRIGAYETFLTRLNQELAGNKGELQTKLQLLFENTVRSLVAAIDAKDYYTGGHSERVAYFSIKIGEALDLSQAELQTLKLGAMMHDIGKIGVPDSVLKKPSELTVDEVLTIREHPRHSNRILEVAPELTELRHMAIYHHEMWNGQGYPFGLKETEIPLFARIVAVADCWDAMLSDRVYRPGMEVDIALSKIQKLGKRQYDPTIIEALGKCCYTMMPLPADLRPLKTNRPPSQNHPPRVGIAEG